MIYGYREIGVIAPVATWLDEAAGWVVTPDGLAAMLLARALSDDHEIACCVRMIAHLGFRGMMDARIRVPVRVYAWVQEEAGASGVPAGQLASALLARALSDQQEVAHATALIQHLGLEGALGFAPGATAEAAR